MRRVIISLFLVGVVVAGAKVCSAADAKLATPDATWDTFKTAMKDKQYKDGFKCMTGDSQDLMLGGMGMAAGFMGMLDPKKGEEAQKILEKHGFKKLDPAQMQGEQDPIKMMKNVVADVKDKPACFAELMEWMEKNAPKQDGQSQTDQMAASKLSDVKVTGDTATGMLTMKIGDREVKQECMFKKIDGNWLLDMATAAQKQAAPAAAPTGAAPAAAGDRLDVVVPAPAK